MLIMFNKFIRCLSSLLSRSAGFKNNCFGVPCAVHEKNVGQHCISLTRAVYLRGSLVNKTTLSETARQMCEVKQQVEPWGVENGRGG